MINDYRFQTDASDGEPTKRLLKRAKFVLLAVGFSAVSYSAYHHWPLGLSTETPAKTTGIPMRETIALALPLELTQTAVEEINKTPDSELTKEPEPPPLQTAIDSDSTALPEVTSSKPETKIVASLQPNSDETSSARSGQKLPPAEDVTYWLQEKVKKGDSLSRIFSRLDLSPGLLHRIVNSGKDAQQLARIKPGETLKVKLDEEGDFLRLILEHNAINSLHIQAVGDKFDTREVERGLEKRIANASGTITNSLYQSAQRAGLSDQLIMELANIFGWDIDFALEIRAGDHFSLVYEEEYLDGSLYDTGSILAAEFINRGKVFRAIRYQDQLGNTNYFSPDGRSMRKAFLRAPVDFRRISSRFTKARWHPVLGKKRPHKGVDYAAAIGTPIKASGDGRVKFRGRKGGYGKTVIIKHGSQYTTLYGHLSRYKKSVKNGDRVTQGEIIGYVGKTGLATGPHLHYEFRVNGVHRNPLTVKIPAASPINKKYKTDFEKKSKPLLAQLDVISRTLVATSE